MRKVLHCFLILFVALLFSAIVCINSIQEPLENKSETMNEQIAIGTTEQAMAKKKSSERDKQTFSTIREPQVVFSAANQEGIKATDFKIEKDDLNKLTRQELIHKADGYAWSLKTGDSVEIIRATIEAGKAENEYYVNLYTQKGTTMTLLVCLNDRLVSSKGIQTNTFGNWFLGTVGDEFARIMLMLIAACSIPIICAGIFMFYMNRKLHRINKLLYETK